MTASRKPRNIVAVTPYVRQDGAKRCKVELSDDGNTLTVALHDLTRPELSKAAAMVFPTIPGNVWLRFKSAPLQSLIRDNDLAAAEAAVAALGTSTSTTDTGVSTETTEEVVESNLGGGAKTDAEQLAELIERMGKGGVDRSELAQIVQAEVEKVAAEVRVTRVEVKLPDRTADLPELHHKDLPKLIAKVAAGVHVFIVGPAGTGKSVAAKQVADSLGRGFQSISFGPTTPTSKLFGFMSPDGRFMGTPLYEAYNVDGPEAGTIFLGDELDNGHPGLLAEQNQFLANGHCAFACGMVERHPWFTYIATANTYGRGGDRLYVGRNQLDAATLDRFVFHLLDIDEKLEEGAAMRFSTNDSAPACREWIATVRKVRSQVAAAKLQHVVSPRASIDGCKLITTGAFTRDEIVRDVLLKGADLASKGITV